MNLTQDFELEIQLQSDWHVGTGEGEPGGIDRLIARDTDGLPYVPAKTLTGIWRDACETAVAALDGGQAGAWHAWLDWIFGSQPASVPQGAPGHATAPIPAALSLRSAHMLPALRTALSGEDARAEALRRELAIVKPSVAIDPRSGRAKDKHLRFDEMARKGMHLRAACRFSTLQGDVPTEASVLLLAGVALVDRLGGKRRRGAGRCAWRVRGVSDADLRASWDWLEACETPAAVPDPAATRATVESFEDHTNDQEDAGSWRDLPLEIELEQAVLASSRVLGNTVESLDFVPGTSLLVPVANRLRAIGFDPWPAIVSGRLRVLPAHVDVRGARGLPAPACLTGPKSGAALPEYGEGADLVEQGWVVNQMVETAGADRGPLRPLRGGFVGSMTDRLPWYQQTPFEGRTHNTIEDATQRPTAAVGGVFTYRAIAAGTRLRSVIRMHPQVYRQLDELDENWWHRLRFHTSMGRSRKDEYGSVSVQASEPVEYAPGAAPRGGILRVWLLSDTLIRDPVNLQPDPTPEGLARHVGGRLGIDLEVGRAFIRRRRIDSWHARWGQPRPSLLAIQAGSCIELRPRDDQSAIDVQSLRHLQAEGLGERRGEGFGDVQIGGPLLDEPLADWRWPEPDGAAEAPETNQADHLAEDSPGWAFARDVESSAWRAEIRRLALARAESAEFRKRALGLTEGKPPASQLGALREAMGQVRAPEGRGWVQTWLASLRSVDGRKAKWPSGALDRLDRLVNEDDRVWSLLDGDNYPVMTADGASALESELWPEAVETLVDACVRAHQRNRGD